MTKTKTFAKIIHSEELQENDYGATKVMNIINSEDWPFSIAKVMKVGDDIKTGFDTESDVAYYVLEGKGICVINGQENKIKKGDCVLIKKGEKYKNLKGLTLLAIGHPKFDRNKREYTE